MDQVAQAIAQKVTAPVPYNKVPLTSFAAGGKFASEYEADVAELYLWGWKALGEDPELARTAILNTKPADFESQKLAPSDDNAPLADKYIDQFSFRLLQVLANEANRTASKAFTELKDLSHFPLALYQPGKN